MLAGGQKGYPMKHAIKALLVETKANDQGEEVFWFQASTATKDREGEIVTVDGWEFENYLKNPVFIVAHDYESLPIGKTVAIIPNELGFKIGVVFDDLDPRAVLIKNKYKNGFMSAVSVGFTRKQQIGRRGAEVWKTIKKELLEVSAVAVPGNPDALIIRKDIEGLEEYVGTKAADFQTELTLDQLRSSLCDRKWKLRSALDRANESAEDDESLTREEKLAAIATNFSQYQGAMLAWYGDYLMYEEAADAAGVKVIKATDPESIATKAGRTLSKKSENSITAAIGHAEKCMGELKGLLECMGSEDPPQEDPPEGEAEKGITTGASEEALFSMGEVAIKADLTALMAFVGNKEET